MKRARGCGWGAASGEGGGAYVTAREDVRRVYAWWEVVCRRACAAREESMEG